MSNNQLDDVICTDEERSNRLEQCKLCENFTINDDGLTQCSASGCLINLMTTFKFKTCPKGNW